MTTNPLLAVICHPVSYETQVLFPLYVYTSNMISKWKYIYPTALLLGLGWVLEVIYLCRTIVPFGLRCQGERFERIGVEADVV